MEPFFIDVIGVWQIVVILILVSLEQRPRWIVPIHGTFDQRESAVHTVNRCCGCCRCVLIFHCFPSFSILGHLWLEEVIYFIFPSLFGLPTGLFVWCLVLKPGFHSAAFFAHRSSGSDAALIAQRKFHFYVFQSSMEFWLPSSLQLLELCFFFMSRSCWSEFSFCIFSLFGR